MPYFTSEAFILVVVPETDRVPKKFRIKYDPVPDCFVDDGESVPILNAKLNDRKLYLGYHPSVSLDERGTISVSIYELNLAGEHEPIARGVLFFPSSGTKFEDV